LRERDVGVGRTETIDGGHARVLAVDDHAPFLVVLRDVVTATGHLEIVDAE
jgi:hypothetical protein